MAEKPQCNLLLHMQQKVVQDYSPAALRLRPIRSPGHTRHRIRPHWGNGAYSTPKSLLVRRLWRFGPRTVSNSSWGLSLCSCLSVP
jgi:hypothetical protein